LPSVLKDFLKTEYTAMIFHFFLLISELLRQKGNDLKDSKINLNNYR